MRKRYYKIVDGVKKYFKGNVLYTETATIVSPTEEMLLADGWIEEVPEEPTEEVLLERAKRGKIYDIEDYDNSENVNEFFLSGHPMWLDSQTRQTLRISVESYAAMDAPTVTKWFNGQQFTFPTSAWLQMLNALEVYAAEALNVTQSHIAAVNAMETVDQVEEFDITSGYPEKLNLTAEWLRSHS